jgi:hypothetical protein
MRFVAVKTKDQGAAGRPDAAAGAAIVGASAHDVSNAIGGHLAELGIVSAKVRDGTGDLLEIIAKSSESRVPPAAYSIRAVLARQYSAIGAEIGLIDKSILAWHRSCEASRRLEGDSGHWLDRRHGLSRRQATVLPGGPLKHQGRRSPLGYDGVPGEGSTPVPLPPPLHSDADDIQGALPHGPRSDSGAGQKSMPLCDCGKAAGEGRLAGSEPRGLTSENESGRPPADRLRVWAAGYSGLWGVGLR